MKKILSIALALCMMLSICVVSVGAADGSPAVVFALSDVTAEAGSTVEVVLSVEENAAFITATIDFEYDKEAMTLTNIACSESAFVLTANVNAGRAVLDAGDDYTGTGDLLTLTFQMAEDATGSHEVTVTYTELYDLEGVLSGMYGDYVAPLATNYPVATVSVPETNPVTDYNVTLGENFGLNFVYKASANDEITVTANGEAVPFTAENGVISVKNIASNDMDTEYTVTVNGWETTVSVKGYCEYVSANSDDAKLVAVADAMIAYGAAANNYFDDANEAVEVPTFDVGTDNPRVVENSTTGGPIFYSVRLQLEDGVFVVVRMKDYNGEDIAVTIDGVESAYTVEDVEGLSAVVIPVKATQYDAPIVIATGNSTLTYSVHTYIQQKQNSSDADLVNLVNALGWYGQAATEYVAE